MTLTLEEQLQDALDACRDYRDENHRLLNLLKRVVEVFEMPTGDLEDAIADIVDDIKLCHPDWQG